MLVFVFEEKLALSGFTNWASIRQGLVDLLSKASSTYILKIITHSLEHL
jgi:hypothetical protein